MLFSLRVLAAQLCEDGLALNTLRYNLIFMGLLMKAFDCDNLPVCGTSVRSTKFEPFCPACGNKLRYVGEVQITQ